MQLVKLLAPLKTARPVLLAAALLAMGMGVWLTAPFHDQTAAQTNSPPVWDPTELTIYVYDATPGGSILWTPLTATDADGDTLSYSLAGDTRHVRLFAIDSSTGQLSLRASTELDAGVMPSYDLIIHASDGTESEHMLLTVEVRHCVGGALCTDVATSEAGNWTGYGRGAANVTPVATHFGEMLPSPEFSVGDDVFTVNFLGQARAGGTSVDALFFLDPVPTAAQRTALNNYTLTIEQPGGTYSQSWTLSSALWVPAGNNVVGHYEWRNITGWTRWTNYDVKLV